MAIESYRCPPPGCARSRTVKAKRGLEVRQTTHRSAVGMRRIAHHNNYRLTVTRLRESPASPAAGGTSKGRYASSRLPVNRTRGFLRGPRLSTLSSARYERAPFGQGNWICPMLMKRGDRTSTSRPVIVTPNWSVPPGSSGFCSVAEKSHWGKLLWQAPENLSLIHI